MKLKYDHNETISNVVIQQPTETFKLKETAYSQNLNVMKSFTSIFRDSSLEISKSHGTQIPNQGIMRYELPRAQVGVSPLFHFSREATKTRKRSYEMEIFYTILINQSKGEHNG